MAEEETTILQMHDLRPAPGAKKDRIRVGRGEGSKGKTSGRVQLRFRQCDGNRVGFVINRNLRLRQVDTDMRLVGQWKPGTADAPVQEFHSDERLIAFANRA